MDVVKTKIMTDTSLYTGFFDAGRKQIASQALHQSVTASFIFTPPT